MNTPRWLELKVPPPVVALAVAGTMWLAARHAPAFGFVFPAKPLRAAIAIALAFAGIALAVAGASAFRKARTTINPMRPGSASALVESGVYRYSRNPIYVGDLLMLLGWGVWLSNALSLLLSAVFVLYMNRFQIAPEERELARLFGPAYADYRSKVRRWA